MKNGSLLRGFLVVLAFAGLAAAQTALPNLTYNASLNAACATPNAYCANSVFTAVSTLVPTGQTGTALDVASNNYALATVTVAGTYSGATIAFDFSDPSGGTSYFQELCTRTDVNILELGEVLPSNQTRAWQCPVFATYRFRVRVSAISSGSINTWITLTQSSIDPSPTVANLPQVTTTSGSAFSSSVQSSLTSSVNVKASAGNVYGVQALNGAASSCWIQFINSSGAGTLGTGVVFSVPLPASTTQPVALGPGDLALSNFTSGIAVGIATTAGGSTPCGTAGQVVVFYN